MTDDSFAVRGVRMQRIGIIAKRRDGYGLLGQRRDQFLALRCGYRDDVDMACSRITAAGAAGFRPAGDFHRLEADAACPGRDIGKWRFREWCSQNSELHQSSLMSTIPFVSNRSTAVPACQHQP